MNTINRISIFGSIASILSIIISIAGLYLDDAVAVWGSILTISIIAMIILGIIIVKRYLSEF